MSERKEYIDKLLAAISPAWQTISIELEERIQQNIERIVTQDDEQARGAIKALRDLIDLPATLQSERDHLTAELSERDSAS